MAGRLDHNNYKSFDYEDSHLTREGWDQAHALGRHIAAAGIRPEVVVVSPLTRAIETAVGCFGDHGDHGSCSSSHNGNGNGNSSGTSGRSGGVGNGPLLMAELTEVPGRRAAHPAVALGAAPPFVCLELCREHLGVSRGSRQLGAGGEGSVDGVLRCAHSTCSCTSSGAAPDPPPFIAAVSRLTPAASHSIQVHPCDKRFPLSTKLEIFPGMKRRRTALVGGFVSFEVGWWGLLAALSHNRSPPHPTPKTPSRYRFL